MDKENFQMMTLKQRLLKWLYPFLMQLLKKGKGNADILKNELMKSPSSSIYDISYEAMDGKCIELESFKGKKILIVNTASDCGFTPQYASLEALYKMHKDHLVIIGFPANDFKQQEPKSNDEIIQFCQKNYGVSFPLSKKIQVVEGEQQHPLYQWLTQPEKNGWNSKQPVWNFSKYLIDENGILLSYMGPSVDPASDAFKMIIGR